MKCLCVTLLLVPGDGVESVDIVVADDDKIEYEMTVL